jgi:hypothetical protein
LPFVNRDHLKKHKIIHAGHTNILSRTVAMHATTGNDCFEIRIRRSNVKASKSMISWDPDGRNESRVKTTNHNHYIQIPQDWQHQLFTHLPHNYPKPSRPNKCNATDIESPNRWKTS